MQTAGHGVLYSRSQLASYRHRTHDHHALFDPNTQVLNGRNVLAEIDTQVDTMTADRTADARDRAAIRTEQAQFSTAVAAQMATDGARAW